MGILGLIYKIEIVCILHGISVQRKCTECEAISQSRAYTLLFPWIQCHHLIDEADLYLVRKLPVNRPMSFRLTPRIESFLLLVLPMPSQAKPAHFGSTSSNSSRCWGRWNFLKDFWHTSVTKNCLRLLNESYGSFGFHQSLSLFVLVGKLLSHHHEAWLERYWPRGIGHTWNTYQGLSGGRW